MWSVAGRRYSSVVRVSLADMQADLQGGVW